MITEEYIENGILIKKMTTEASDKRTDEEKNIILDICNKCQFKNNSICDKCGCLIESRIQYKTTNCPINKW